MTLLTSNLTRCAALALLTALTALSACTGDALTTPTDRTPPDTGTPTGSPEPDPVFATLVRATLFTDDLEAAQAAHDAVASAGEQPAHDAGDFAHDALTGSGLLGTPLDAFLGLDRWNDADAMAAFYADPAFAEGFLGLFAGPPTVEAFEAQPDWYNWGSLEAGDGGEYWFAIARGTLAEADPAAAQAAHDAVASGGEAGATAAGDVAHVVFTGLADPRAFLAVDVWSRGDAIEAVYTDPTFGAAFGALFEGPATVQVYHSTDWVQW